MCVGSQVASYRELAGMAQEELAEAVGVTFQQLQKYERGINRISANRLFGIAQTLNVPIGVFFQNSDVALVDETADGLAREGIAIMRAFVAIADPATRLHVLALVRQLAGHETTG